MLTLKLLFLSGQYLSICAMAVSREAVSLERIVNALFTKRFRSPHSIKIGNSLAV